MQAFQHRHVRCGCGPDGQGRFGFEWRTAKSQKYGTKSPEFGDPLKPAILIHENYGAYKPSLNARKTVESLIASIEPEYLQGLGSIVLSSQFDLPRTKRRKKFLSRGSKYSTSAIQAYYQAQWKGQPAFIELYIDKILAPIPSWFARFPTVGFLTIGKVFFHELGHHIHQTIRPEFKEKEDVADQWSRKLMKNAFLKHYRYAVPFLRPAVKLMAAPIERVVTAVNRHYDGQELKRSRSNDPRD
jgi:hypothetical protein